MKEVISTKKVMFIFNKNAHKKDKSLSVTKTVLNNIV